MAKFRKIGVLTSGGDAPGMNATVRAVARAAISRGVEVIGIYEGYKGLIHTKRIVDGKELDSTVHLDNRAVDNIISRGGTMLWSDRCLEFKEEAGILAAKRTCEELGIDGIVAIGGDGTFRGATDFTNYGVPCIGLPGTIDNDITSTDESIGFDTAMNTVVEMVDRLRDTCDSHRRCNVVEVMGRAAGYIALEAGIATGASAIAVKEIPFDEDACIAKLIAQKESGKRNFIVMVAEGIPLDAAGDKEYSEMLAKRIQEKTGIETKFARLAHVVRGGSPTLRDRLLAARLGDAAVEELLAGKSNLVMCLQNDQVVGMDIGYALSLDRLYKGKVKPGELEAKYTPEQIADMHTFCDRKLAAFKKLYETANRISN